MLNSFRHQGGRALGSGDFHPQVEDGLVAYDTGRFAVVAAAAAVV